MRKTEYGRQRDTEEPRQEVGQRKDETRRGNNEGINVRNNIQKFGMRKEGREVQE